MQELPRVLPLSKDVSIPVLGLGVWQASPRETRAACLAAFEAGYRHVDTASMYGNEKEVGEAVRASGLPRAELFVTTKLWNSDHGYEKALKAFAESHKKLGLDQVDLFLIHYPAPGRVDSWRALVKLKADGLCRAIGVSNYEPRHIDQILDIEKPSVNQVELSPFLQQRELAEYSRKHGIVLEAYSPITRGEKLSDPAIRKIAAKHARTPAQVMLRWIVEQGHVVLPKSVRPERMKENAALFDWALDDSDREGIAKLDAGYRTCWDPTEVP